MSNVEVKEKSEHALYEPKRFPGWMKYLPAKLRSNERLRKFRTVEDLAEAYLKITSR